MPEHRTLNRDLPLIFFTSLLPFCAQVHIGTSLPISILEKFKKLSYQFIWDDERHSMVPNGTTRDLGVRSFRIFTKVADIKTTAKFWSLGTSILAEWRKDRYNRNQPLDQILFRIQDHNVLSLMETLLQSKKKKFRRFQSVEPIIDYLEKGKPE